MVSKQELLDSLAEVSQRLHQAMEGVDAEQMTLTHTIGQWSIQDVLGHVASWHEQALRRLDYVCGQPAAEVAPLPWINDEAMDEWNEQEARRKRSLGLPQVMEQLQTAREAVVARMGTITEADYEADRGELTIGRWLYDFTVGHEAEHCAAIELWHRGELADSRSLQGR